MNKSAVLFFPLLLLLLVACTASEKGATKAAATPEKAAPSSNQPHPMVIIKTSMGEIKAELYSDRAPISVQNFLQYVDDRFYDGTIFHRVIDGFMIQGGGMDVNLNKKPTRAPIKNESDNGLENVTGTLAMARTMVPDSASSQFFVNVADNAFLDRSNSQDGVGYCVFGRVVEGMDVVNQIKGVPTGTYQGMQDVPAQPVLIESIRRADSPPAGEAAPSSAN